MGIKCNHKCPSNREAEEGLGKKEQTGDLKMEARGWSDLRKESGIKE